MVREHASELSASLPLLAKYMLLAAFLASYNPEKTDATIFGRGGNGRKRRAKISQKDQSQLGPQPFEMRRLFSILECLLSNDNAARARACSTTLHRTELQTQLSSLISLNLLLRVSAEQELDSVRLRCNVAFELIKNVAQNCEVDLSKYMIDGGANNHL